MEVQDCTGKLLQALRQSFGQSSPLRRCFVQLKHCDVDKYVDSPINRFQLYDFERESDGWTEWCEYLNFPESVRKSAQIRLNPYSKF